MRKCRMRAGTHANTLLLPTGHSTAITVHSARLHGERAERQRQNEKTPTCAHTHTLRHFDGILLWALSEQRDALLRMGRRRCQGSCPCSLHRTNKLAQVLERVRTHTNLRVRGYWAWLGVLPSRLGTLRWHVAHVFSSS